MKLTITNNGDLIFLSEYLTIYSESEYGEFYLRIGNVNKQNVVIANYNSYFCKQLYFYLGLYIKFLPQFNKSFELCNCLFEVTTINEN